MYIFRKISHNLFASQTRNLRMWLNQNFISNVMFILSINVLTYFNQNAFLLKKKTVSSIFFFFRFNILTYYDVRKI